MNDFDLSDDFADFVDELTNDKKTITLNAPLIIQSVKRAVANYEQSTEREY